MLDRLTDTTKHLLDLAEGEARAFGHPFVGTIHLLIAMAVCEDSATARVFSELGLHADQLRNTLRKIVGEGDEQLTSNIPLSVGVKRALLNAVYIADLTADRSPIDAVHVLLGMFSFNNSVSVRTLQDHGVSVEDVCTMALYELACTGGPAYFMVSHQPCGCMEAVPQMRLTNI